MDQFESKALGRGGSMKWCRHSVKKLMLAFIVSMTGVALGQNTGHDATSDAAYVNWLAADVSGTQGANIAAEPTMAESKLGPVLPEDIRLVGSAIPSNALTEWGSAHRLRFFGWANGGYTWSSSGTGLLRVEPRMNRFGDAWLLDQSAFVLERTLDESGWSWGFRGEFYMGSDAALLHSPNGFGPSPTDNPRFSTDFRQAYLSFHAPILTKQGVDVKIGRQYTPIGYETAMSPYRPMYSFAYAWMYSQNGATTGATATVHVSPKLDVLGGVTFGANSMYNLEGRAPNYTVRGLYWLGTSKRTKLVGTFFTGPKPIGSAKGRQGKWQSIVEAQLIHNVNRRLTLVSETNVGWDTRDPGHQFRTSQWYGTYGMGIVHVNPYLDINSRAEWFKDADGSRVGTRGNYGEITVGPNIMPTHILNFRPEVRWDRASNRVFGPVSSSSLKDHQWTYALEALVKF
jgi:Putative beta-barrel porin-2, OmpL-like. bbp2